jgi:hypothetical protein
MRIGPKVGLLTACSVGVAVGVTALDAADRLLSPIALRAATLKVYLPPFFSPLIVWLSAGFLKIRGVCAFPPRNGVTT